jgi:hypothetical protein
MGACSLEIIVDIDTLRQMVREQRICIATRDPTIAANKCTLRERDSLIGKLKHDGTATPGAVCG